MSEFYPVHLRSQLNPILLWDKPTLEGHVQSSEQMDSFYSTMATVIRVVVVILGLGILLALGMLNPFYFPIVLSLLMVTYHPFMSVTYHLFNEWAQAAKEEAQKYQMIIDEMDAPLALPFEIPEHEGFDEGQQHLVNLINAQFLALEKQVKPHDHPDLPGLIETYHNDPSEESLKKVYLAQHEQCVWRHTNIRFRIQQAYLCHVALHPLDKRSLLDFGEYQHLPVTHVLSMGNHPVSVFLLKDENRSITSNAIQEHTTLEVATNLFIELEGG